MKGFPATPDYSGLNEPVGVECDFRPVSIEGQVPPEIDGVFYRAVPDPAFPPFVEDGAAYLSGDGMITALRVSPRGASFASRYVQTERHKAEVAAGRALFGKYRNAYTDRPEAQGLDRTVANTTPLWHAGRLLMTKEDGRPYRIDPRTLDTIGRFDYGGKWRSQTHTAHARLDPETGELFFFGYEADGPASTKVAYGVAGRNGELASEQWLDVPYCGLMHDFAITRNHALFPLYPTTCDLARLRSGGDHWVHEMERDSWVGVMPRYGSVSQLRWFRGPKGVSCFHMMNAFEDEAGRIQFDQCLANVNQFPFIQRASGLDVPPPEAGARLARWTIDPGNRSDTVTETVIGPPGDMPVIPASMQGRPYTHAWLASIDPETRGPPIVGGPMYAMFNVLLRLDFTGKAPQALELPPGHCCSEPVHVPASRPGHEGWLLAVVDRERNPGEFTHEVWIVDAGNLAAGPVARIAIPARLRAQVHGSWVSAAQLASAA